MRSDLIVVNRVEGNGGERLDLVFEGRAKFGNLLYAWEGGTSF